MTGTTSPLGFPYVQPADPMSIWPAVQQQLAEALDDYLATLAAVAPADWTALAVTGGIAPGGSVQYARRAGVVFLELAFDVPGGASPGANLTTAIPSGFRPARQIVRQVQGGGNVRGVYMDPDGILRADFGGSVGPAGYFGGFAYPV